MFTRYATLCNVSLKLWLCMGGLRASNWAVSISAWQAGHELGEGVRGDYAGTTRVL